MLDKNRIFNYGIINDGEKKERITIDEGMTRRNLTYHDLNVVEFN